MDKQLFLNLYEQAALDLYADFQRKPSVIRWLKNRLPDNLKVDYACLVNNEADTFSPVAAILTHDDRSILYEKTPLRAAITAITTIKASLSIIPQLNQQSLAKYLKQMAVVNQLAKNREVKPLQVWWCDDLSSFLTINDLEDRLLAEEIRPDLVVVVNQGILVSTKPALIEQIYLLRHQISQQAYDQNLLSDWVSIAEKLTGHNYLKLEASAAYLNLFNAYILLLELLKYHNKPNEPIELAPEMIAVFYG